ncbi:macrolide transporter [Bacillus manliponensis]|uniref:Macrolide transporter n=1 Tax=Bacillus manliponensis TaxID=574376 RepID=A0A073KCJ5_9BACI|nr:MFS transporter [Bacillus manliponensis]KEK19998.1 macrolide transporter [Bacillus manliponensis]
MNRTLSTYWFANMCISLADVMYIMIITTHIYLFTKSATIAALFPLLKIIMNVFANMSVSSLTNRFPSSTLLIRLQLIKTTFLITLTVLFPILSPNIFTLFIFVAIISLCEGWSRPLLYTIIPRLAEENQLAKVNSIFTSSSQIVQAAAYTFTSIIVIMISVPFTMMINNVCMILSCIALFIVTRKLQTGEEQSIKTNTLKKSWSLLFQHPSLRMVTIMDMIESLAGTIWIGAVTMAFVTTVLQKGAEWWGYINTSYYIGTILGGLLAWRFSTYIQNNLIRSMAFGSLLFSILTFLYGINSSGFIALLLCVFMGPAYQFRDIAQTTVLQTSVAPSLLSNVYAAHHTLVSAMSGISMLGVGMIADLFGARTVYIVASILILLSATLSFTLLKQQNKENGVSL